MTALTQCAGLVAGLSTVAVLGVAVAQGVPPNPLISNPAVGAGQQTSFLTPMGETGVLAQVGEARMATITKEPEVAAAPQPAPEPVATVPAPAPAPVAVAPVPEPTSTTVAMGAGHEPQQHAPMRVRRDRN